jgi:protein TonB
VQVGPQGHCRNAQVVSSSGYDVLDEAAVEAVRGWEFTPATRLGRAIDASIDLTFNFVLQAD